MNTRNQGHNSGSRHRNLGFTLIELLVVISIIGFLIGLSSILRPAETIILGEKRADSQGDSYMDIWPPQYGSDHLTEVAHGKHRSGGDERKGGSNYAFADGSARFLKYGAAFSPKNLWAVTDQFRDAPRPEL
jgi:prepilin-type N-terminal cleavage/methylation domain-containing protein/prepilin-type processing-associated H-X9-DG protein